MLTKTNLNGSEIFLLSISIRAEKTVLSFNQSFDIFGSKSRMIITTPHLFYGGFFVLQCTSKFTRLTLGNQYSPVPSERKRRTKKLFWTKFSWFNAQIHNCSGQIAFLTRQQKWITKQEQRLYCVSDALIAQASKSSLHIRMMKIFVFRL